MSIFLDLSIWNTETILADPEASKNDRFVALDLFRNFRLLLKEFYQCVKYWNCHSYW